MPRNAGGFDVLANMSPLNWPDVLSPLSTVGWWVFALNEL